MTMANRLRTQAEVLTEIMQMSPSELKQLQKYAREDRKKKENLTELTDKELKTRIWYSQDQRAGESFGPLFEECIRRYKQAKQECRILSQTTARGSLKTIRRQKLLKTSDNALIAQASPKYPLELWDRFNELSARYENKKAILEANPGKRVCDL